jgi:hypothetical protein
MDEYGQAVKKIDEATKNSQVLQVTEINDSVLLTFLLGSRFWTK